MKENIPTIQEEKACNKIIEAVQNNATLRAIPKERRTKKFATERLEKETMLLQKMFPL